MHTTTKGGEVFYVNFEFTFQFHSKYVFEKRTDMSFLEAINFGYTVIDIEN